MARKKKKTEASSRLSADAAGYEVVLTSAYGTKQPLYRAAVATREAAFNEARRLNADARGEGLDVRKAEIPGSVAAWLYERPKPDVSSNRESARLVIRSVAD